MGRTSTPDTSHKTHKRRSTVDQNTRVQKKKERRHSSNNIDILTQVGLVDNHLSPLRRNNTILDRPEVTLPVIVKHLFALSIIYLMKLL